MARSIVAILALFIIAIFAIAGFSAALENAGTDVTVENETFVPDAGNVTELDDSNLNGAYYSHTVDVFDNSGVEMEDGVDYEWFDSNGTILTIPGGDLDGAPEATITYSYQLTTQEQRQFAALLGVLPQALAAAGPALLLVLFLVILRS